VVTFAVPSGGRNIKANVKLRIIDLIEAKLLLVSFAVAFGD
jgi:hypothetical protein